MAKRTIEGMIVDVKLSERDIERTCWMMEIHVEGTPAPQGSKRFVGHSKSGRGIMIESSKQVKPWREAVKFAAHEAMMAIHQARWVATGVREHTGIIGPVVCEMVFTMRKPKSAPKGRRTWPSTKPDIDKICRSTLDALKDVGTIEDDSRIVDLHARKVFPGEDPDALPVPGAIIRIKPVI